MSTAIAEGSQVQSGRALIRRVIDFAHAQRYQAGDRFPAERLLAERLGVSRNALREALSTLESLRVIESRPNSGVYLRRLATESSFEAMVLLAEMGSEPNAIEVRETIEVRASLECQALTLACERRTEQDLDALRAILRETDTVLAAGENIVDCDQAFHLAVVTASHNSVLVRMLHAFYCLTLARRREFFADPARGAASAASHEKILKAIEKRDVRRATQLIVQHLDNAQVYWREALDAGSENSDA